MKYADDARAIAPLLNRREMLQVGAVSMLGLALPAFLRADGGKRQVRARAEKSCIFIMLNGGPSHIDTLDPKPDAPREIRGLYQPIPTRTPGVYFSEMLPRLASVSDRYCLIRSMSHKLSDHVQATHVCLSGQSDGSPRNNTPYFGSMMAKIKPSVAEVPSYVWLHNLLVGTKKLGRQENGGALGAAYAPLRIGGDLHTPAAPGFRVKAFDPPPKVSSADLQGRYDLKRKLASTGPAGLAVSAEDPWVKLQERAFDLVTRPQARHAFDLNQEVNRVRERYGRHPLGQYLLLARRLIEAGVRLVGVAGCPGTPPGCKEAPPRQVWDMHDLDVLYSGNENMYGTGMFGLGFALPRLDQAVSALLEDLDERGLLETTLVVVAGEFGRTPRFEGTGRGRGHWSDCYTALLAGAGVRGGAVYGQSDKIGAYVKHGQPVTPENFGATIYHALGVAPEMRPDSRNLGLRVSNGEPLLKLFR